MEEIFQYAPDLWQLSLPWQGERGIIGPYLLTGKQQVALVDPGPESTLPALLQQLQKAGFQPEDVTHILVTHIHFDHAGSVGTLLQHHLPHARAYIHSIGAPHLQNPTRLITSATRIYGEQMEALWGKIEAVPADRLEVIDEGDQISVAGRMLDVLYTPGHAIHHVSFHDAQNHDLFTGDVAGIRLEIDYIYPPTPPPDLDLEAWYRSIERIKRLQPKVLYPAHFGPSHNVQLHLDMLQASLEKRADVTLQAIQAGLQEQEIAQKLTDLVREEIERLECNQSYIRGVEMAANSLMNAQGYIRYWRKVHPEALHS